MRRRLARDLTSKEHNRLLEDMQLSLLHSAHQRGSTGMTGLALRSPEPHGAVTRRGCDARVTGEDNAAYILSEFV